MMNGDFNVRIKNRPTGSGLELIQDTQSHARNTPQSSETCRGEDIERGNKMKIVKFKDGTYGIRRWSIIGYQYKDIKSDISYWWTLNTKFIGHCKGTYPEILEIFERMTDKGKIVKENRFIKWVNNFELTPLKIMMAIMLGMIIGLIVNYFEIKSIR